MKTEWLNECKCFLYFYTFTLFGGEDAQTKRLKITNHFWTLKVLKNIMCQK